MGDFDSIGAGKMIKASPPLLLLLLLLFCLGVATPAAGAVRMAPVFNPVLFENLDICFTFHAKCPPGLNYWGKGPHSYPGVNFDDWGMDLGTLKSQENDERRRRRRAVLPVFF